MRRSTGPHRSPETTAARRRTDAGTTLLELLVVVVIIGILMSLFVVGANTWRTNMQVKQTRATLEILETIVDEYYVQTEGYFDSAVASGDVVVPPAAGFLQTAEDVGDIYNLTGALRKNDAGTRVVDGWGKSIQFYNPNTGSGSPTKRPVFWSFGPDEINDSGLGDVPGWSDSASYNPGDTVHYDGKVYECTNAASGTGQAPGDTGHWDLKDDIGTF